MVNQTFYNLTRKKMDYDEHIASNSWSKPFKRKRGVLHLGVCAEKSPECQTTVPNQRQDPCTVTDVALDPLRVPNTYEGISAKPRRYYWFSVCKMVRLAKSQTKFLHDFLRCPDWDSPNARTFEALSHHIGVCRADPTSTDLAFFYMATTTVCGTCIAKHKKRKCVVLGMEYRMNSSSFRLYLAYFSQSRFYMICHIQFLIKQFFPNRMPNVVHTIMEYCFHGLVQEGFEIVGAHYMDPRKATGKPYLLATKTKHTRHFTSMWNHTMEGLSKDSVNFLIKHARRDVQVFDLRVESKLYMNLVCGKVY